MAQYVRRPIATCRWSWEPPRFPSRVMLAAGYCRISKIYWSTTGGMINRISVFLNRFSFLHILSKSKYKESVDRWLYFHFYHVIFPWTALYTVAALVISGLCVTSCNIYAQFSCFHEYNDFPGFIMAWICVFSCFFFLGKLTQSAIFDRHDARVHVGP